MRTFIDCDAHPAVGGPHRSRGVYVGTYFGMAGVRVVACTHRSKRGRVCGVLMIEFDKEVDR
jgi:hypothetical protein